MKRIVVVLVFLAAAAAQAQQHPAQHKDVRAGLMPGLGALHHPVSTNNAEAQRFFDQGLRLIYAFNHDEAERSFRRAAELDPQLAMAWWGIAYALGPNYNLPVDAAREKAAYHAIQKALSLAAKAPENERAYIEALAKRYSDQPNPDYRQLALNFKDAMGALAKRYLDDLDAATLCAESMMNLHPWGLWKHDGTPTEGTPEILAVLETVLKRNPRHMGAVHYYLHAVEASPQPERGLAGANVLASLAPSAGHLVHMPAHIYIRTGDYRAATSTNVKAAAADETYIKASGVQGIYPLMYYSHNLHFIAVAAGMEGRFAEAKTAAERLVAHVGPHVKDMPPLEGFMTVPSAVLARFQRWDEILKAPQPDAGMKTATAFWHYARGMALAATGKLTEAESERKAVAEAGEQTPPDAIFAMPFNNLTRNILKIADHVLNAKIALARQDSAAAIGLLRDAVAIQDNLKYGEPPDWYFPVRESLGAALLSSGDAAAAEKVFREDLERNPRNGRSLFGLHESLNALGRTHDAQFVEQQLQAAWKNADTPLKLQDL